MTTVCTLRCEETKHAVFVKQCDGQPTHAQCRNLKSQEENLFCVLVPQIVQSHKRRCSTQQYSALVCFTSSSPPLLLFSPFVIVCVFDSCLCFRFEFPRESRPVTHGVRSPRIDDRPNLMVSGSQVADNFLSKGEQTTRRAAFGASSAAQSSRPFNTHTRHEPHTRHNNTIHTAGKWSSRRHGVSNHTSVTYILILCASSKTFVLMRDLCHRSQRSDNFFPNNPRGGWQSKTLTPPQILLPFSLLCVTRCVCHCAGCSV